MPGNLESKQISAVRRGREESGELLMGTGLLSEVRKNILELVVKVV